MRCPGGHVLQEPTPPPPPSAPVWPWLFHKAMCKRIELILTSHLSSDLEWPHEGLSLLPGSCLLFPPASALTPAWFCPEFLLSFVSSSSLQCGFLLPIQALVLAQTSIGNPALTITLALQWQLGPDRVTWSPKNILLQAMVQSDTNLVDVASKQHKKGFHSSPVPVPPIVGTMSCNAIPKIIKHHFEKR